MNTAPAAEAVPNVVAVLTDMTSEVLSVLAVWMDEHGVASIKPF